MPDIPGMSSFTGSVLCHSSQFPGAQPYQKGKKAVVIGACNSSHDICQDYHEQGYDVTMVQRSTTCVVSSESATEILLGTLFEEGGPPTEDADLWMWGHPAETLKALHADLCTKQQEKDKVLLQGLEKVGFKLDKGPNDCGLFIKYLQRGGGYYFDVGASQLIVDGQIAVKHAEVAEILPAGVRFTDGSEIEADEVVFATGYENMKTQARTVFGDAVGDRVRDVWGFDEHGEVRSLWRKSGHPGFWFHGGNLAMCRYYSRFLALQIKAQLLGLPGAE
jgi:cation diffusion facilitator CzcD-associated flavoprotein CzcO